MLKLWIAGEIEKKKETRCLLSPENRLWALWEGFVTIVLVYSCIITPLQMALFEDLSVTWQVINYVVDIIFLIDIIVIFNTATYDDDFSIIEDRVAIAKEYLSSWFFIDFIAILPFELMIPKGESANIVRLSRMGRIYKILKLLKLIRIMKLSKSHTFSFLETFSNFLRIAKSIRWFAMFLVFFFLTSHVIACIWIIVGNFDSD